MVLSAERDGCAPVPGWRGRLAGWRKASDRFSRHRVHATPVPNTIQKENKKQGRNRSIHPPFSQRVDSRAGKQSNRASWRHIHRTANISPRTTSSLPGVSRARVHSQPVRNQRR